MFVNTGVGGSDRPKVLMRTSKKLTLIGVGATVLLVGGWGFSTLSRASTAIDPSKIATVERGTMVRSVVATG